jgi:hypothetical protein
VARLRLDQPGDREAARNFVMGKFSAAAGVVLQDDLARRIAARGSVTHLTYATKSDGDGWDVSVRDGLAVGIDHANEDTQQHLVGADVVVAGKRLERYDCLGLDAA